MKKKVFIFAGIAIILFACLLIFKPFGKKNAPYTFETVRVEKGKISNVVTATGTIEAVTSVDVGTQVSGIIEKIYVDFNDQVKQGQLLAQLDKKQLIAQLEQSKATLDQAQAQLTYQESTFKRLKVLYEKQLIAQSDYDQALYNYENAKATVKNAKSAYERNLVNLNYATITSPINGVVLNRAIEEGQTVAASFNTPTLFTIVNDLTQMEVEASVSEADIGQVKTNQHVEFSVDAYPDKKFVGLVAEVRLQPTTTNNVVTYAVILSAPNPEKLLMPGMTADATIIVDEKDSTLILAGKATRFTPDMEFMKAQFKKMGKIPGKNIPMGQGAKPGAMPGATGGAAQGSGAMPGANGGAAQGSGAMGANPAAMGGAQGGNMPTGGFPPLPEGTKMVWVKDGKGGLRPSMIKVGLDNGNSVEVLSGLKEGDEVVISMTNQASKSKQKANSNRGPFPF